MGNILAKSAAVDVAIQWSLFVVAAAMKTEKFYDLAGAATFLLLTYLSAQWGGTFHARQRVQSSLVAIWAARLGSFLFTRVLRDGGDKRFNKVKGNPRLFFMYWTLQAVWIFMTLLPTLILNSHTDDRELSRRDAVGWGMWYVGFMLEAVADWQKSTFRSNPANAGKFISSGLWKYSRHPNYLGEILLWSGLFVSASSVMSGLEFASVISPIFVAYLITKVSGIPILERTGMRRWGTDDRYLNYVNNTAVIVPYLW